MLYKNYQTKEELENMDRRTPIKESDATIKEFVFKNIPPYLKRQQTQIVFICLIYPNNQGF